MRYVPTVSLIEFEPPLSSPEALQSDLSQRGFAIASPGWVCELARTSQPELSRLGSEWNDLPSDPHLLDAGHYRRRLHASFIVEADACRQVTHRPHFQPPQYNALHGGLLRWFSPMRSSLLDAEVWSRLVCGLGKQFSELSAVSRWFVEAHQFRIHTADGVGRPTPEGAHRDGVDFVALLLVDRHRIRGGETRVFDARQPTGLRFTLREPWTVLLLDDARVVHESTPILPDPAAGDPALGHRDTLVLTYRRDGFQEPSEGSARA